jgi:hypothetical protein
MKYKPQTYCHLLLQIISLLASMMRELDLLFWLKQNCGLWYYLWFLLGDYGHEVVMWQCKFSSKQAFGLIRRVVIFLWGALVQNFDQHFYACWLKPVQYYLKWWIH